MARESQKAISGGPAASPINLWGNRGIQALYQAIGIPSLVRAFFTRCWGREGSARNKASRLAQTVFLLWLHALFR